MGGVCGKNVSKETKLEVNEDILKILAKLDLKIDEYNQTFEKNQKEAEDKQKNQLEKRHEKLVELKSKNAITEEEIKKLNKEELGVENGFLSNAVDKWHFILDNGMEIIEPIKKITMDQMTEKAKKSGGLVAKGINKKIEEIKNMQNDDFLESTYGKCIKDALVKKGLSKTALINFKNKLYEKRHKRREEERKEFDIKENEFPNEFDKIDLSLDSLIKSEFKDLNKKFEEYKRDKGVEAIHTAIFK